MIYADHVNNTALYGFHPDFVRDENDDTPVHQVNVERKFEFGDLQNFWTEVFLAWLAILMFWLLLGPLFA